MKLEVAQAMVSARCWGRCEGCGAFGPIQVHHRLARGMGGLRSRAAEDVSNDVRSLLALCVPCHGATEDAATWRDCEAKGWRFRHGVDDPREQPALIHTVNGYGWWYLTEMGGYRWADLDGDYRLPLVATPDS